MKHLPHYHNKCDAPDSGGLVDNPSTRRNLWISGAPISHSHVSYIETHSYIFNSQYTKIYIDYDHSLFDTKNIYMFWFCLNIKQDKNKTKKNKAVFGSHPICKSAAYTRPLPERGIPQRGEQSPVVIISYKGCSPPKCSCSDQTHTHSSKNMHILTRMFTSHG